MRSKKKYSDKMFNEDGLESTFGVVYEKTKKKFVFVIDEWDCLFRRRADDVKGQEKYLEFLNNKLLKGKRYLALVYMTGILPIKKTGDESSLNMFSEKTIIDASPLQEYFGFTEAEVESLCMDCGRPYENVKNWYDGYTVNGVRLYNPLSVTESLKSGLTDDYWTRTQTFDVLHGYMSAVQCDIYGDMAALLAGNSVRIDVLKFKNNLTAFTSKDDLFTLLVHLGYLTYDFISKTVRIPDYEIYLEYVSVADELAWEDASERRMTAEEFARKIRA